MDFSKLKEDIERTEGLCEALSMLTCDAAEGVESDYCSDPSDSESSLMYCTDEESEEEDDSSDDDIAILGKWNRRLNTTYMPVVWIAFMGVSPPPPFINQGDAEEFVMLLMRLTY
jgi:hypothetical protein